MILAGVVSDAGGLMLGLAGLITAVGALAGNRRNRRTIRSQGRDIENQRADFDAELLAMRRQLHRVFSAIAGASPAARAEIVALLPDEDAAEVTRRHHPTGRRPR